MSLSDVHNYLEDLDIRFGIIGNFKNTVDLESDEISLSVISGLSRKGGMVYEGIAYETWWYIRPEEGSYSEAMKKLRERRTGSNL